jgi:hypothetical protein
VNVFDVSGDSCNVVDNKVRASLSSAFGTVAEVVDFIAADVKVFGVWM